MAPTKKQSLEFARGFKRLDRDQIKKAMIWKTKIIKSSFKNNDLILEGLLDHFKPIPDPKDELDWLVQYRERGQSVNQFAQYTPVPVQENFLGKKQFVYFVKVGDFKESQMSFDSLMEYSKCFFNENAIKVLPGVIDVELEKNDSKRDVANQRAKIKYNDAISSIKIRYDKSSDRWQIMAPSIHDFLDSIKPKDALGLIGFTEYDLFCDKSDLFVAGLCDGYLNVGIFSCFRYNPSLVFSEERWFETKITRTKASSKNTEKDKEIHLNRSCKLLVHETCHLLGIDHCIYMDCCMNGSGHIKEDYRQSMFLCPVDLKKLSLIMDIDISSRYEKLKAFFAKQSSAKAELKWLDKVIKSIKN